VQGSSWPVTGAQELMVKFNHLTWELIFSGRKIEVQRGNGDPEQGPEWSPEGDPK